MKPQKLPFDAAEIQAVRNAAKAAKANQIAEMKAAADKFGKRSLEAFWAGSATASFAHHVAAGAVHLIDAVLPNAPSDEALENLGTVAGEVPEIL